MGTVALICTVNDHGSRYEAIMVWCPGCQYADSEDGHPRGGLHMLPVQRGGSGGEDPRPTWGWNGDLVNVTLTPSILTKMTRQTEHVCHSFLTNGVWNFLSDCTHDMANRQVPMVDLPDWVTER